MREFPFSISQMAYKVLELAGLLQSPEIGVSSIIDAALAPPVSLPLLLLVSIADQILFYRIVKMQQPVHNCIIA